MQVKDFLTQHAQCLQSMHWLMKLTKCPLLNGFCLYQDVDLQCSADDKLKGRTLEELERDVEEASARLAMAHKEIRRLTDELESAHLTQKAYGKSTSLVSHLG